MAGPQVGRFGLARLGLVFVDHYATRVQRHLTVPRWMLSADATSALSTT